jgi:hypothetical protein
MTDRLVLGSLSGAMDGGLTAIAEVAEILGDSNMLEQSRLIGGVTVLLHHLRLGVDLPLRVTGEADFGVLERDHGNVDASSVMSSARDAGLGSTS